MPTARSRGRARLSHGLLRRKATHAPSGSGQDANALLACFGYVVVFTFIGIRWFRWESR